MTTTVFPLAGQAYPNSAQYHKYLLTSLDSSVSFSRLLALEFLRRCLFSFSMTRAMVRRRTIESTVGCSLASHAPN